MLSKHNKVKNEDFLKTKHLNDKLTSLEERFDGSFLVNPSWCYESIGQLCSRWERHVSSWFIGSNKKSNHINFSERKWQCLSKLWTLLIRVSLTWNIDDHWNIKTICDSFYSFHVSSFAFSLLYYSVLLGDWLFFFVVVGIQYCLFTGRFISLVLISLWAIDLF